MRDPAFLLISSCSLGPLRQLTIREERRIIRSGLFLAIQRSMTQAVPYRGEQAHDVDPSDDPESFAYNPPQITWGNPGYPCYEHATLTDLLDNHQPHAISWRYYGWKKAESIWNAPWAIYHICLPTGSRSDNGVCDGLHFHDGSITTTQGQILTDVGNCQLPRMSWVMPDGNWSDYAGQHATKKGPVWVARIVNKIGNSGCTDNINGVDVPYWKDTVILITWDDWGGWYDHIRPYAVIRDGVSWGSGYVSSFRVPLLVVSAYTDFHTISGPASNPDCTNSTYCHDFGSILAFIEHNFGVSEIGFSDSLNYADHFAPDNKPPHVPLSEFFNLTQARDFHQIILPPDAPSEEYFTSYTGAVPPDDDN